MKKKVNLPNGMDVTYYNINAEVYEVCESNQKLIKNINIKGMYTIIKIKSLEKWF